MRTCFFPGSFDPPTVGHIDLIRRTAAIFDRVIVAVMENGQKNAAFSSAERAELLKTSVQEMPGVRVVVESGLAVDAAKRAGADVIVRGLRGEADVSIECQMAALNRQLSGIETVFLFTRPEHSHISSTMVREILRHGGPVAGMVPEAIEKAVQARF